MVKLPGKYDSTNLLIWKFSYNCWYLAATQSGYTAPAPDFGSSDQLLLRRALEALIFYSEN